MQDPTLKQLLYQLMQERASPARVVLGYEGYKTVDALRNGLAEHLSTLSGKHGAGPSSLPDLILNPNAAVVKANGFPYVTHLTADGAWPLLLSAASALPPTTLLEVIWTRANMRVEGAAIDFGADLDVDSLAKLADYRHLPGRGWEVVVFDLDKSLLHVDVDEWEPEFLNDTEHTVLMWMAAHGEIDLDHPPADSDPQEIESAVMRLAQARLIGPDAHRDRVFRQLTHQCDVINLPDGRIAAGENVSGR